MDRSAAYQRFDSLAILVLCVWLMFEVRPVHAAAPDSISFTNIVDPEGPWIVRVVKVPRRSAFELRSVHAAARAIGLGELSRQASSAQADGVEAVAGINGDFYQRDGAHAGDPRGLQIVDGELISGPSDSASVWFDLKNEPQIAVTSSQFTVTWPDGASMPFGLNGDRQAEAIELYTPAMGRSTRAERGREITLEPEGNATFPLRPGRTFKARVRSIRDGANGEIAPGTVVLSIGPVMAREVPKVTPGTSLTLSLATTPDLRGAKLALSGGPILLQDGKGYSSGLRLWRSREAGSPTVRHPRSAFGWNKDFYFLVQVDGRNRRSVGMTLSELSEAMRDLGCTHALNLDGGGSSTLWYDGRVRNRPCDGEEREIANSLVVVRKANPEGARTAQTQAPSADE